MNDALAAIQRVCIVVVLTVITYQLSEIIELLERAS